MRISPRLCILFACLPAVLSAASKPHIVALGKWTTVKWFDGERESDAVDLKIRPLLVDGRIKEFVVGAFHDVTERAFVAQRVYRLNDSLPQESPVRWRWERGGWLLIDRMTGKVQAITLPGFDSYESSVTWFRDYAAYCGFSDDGAKVFATVVQLGKRKPLLKKQLGDGNLAGPPDSACAEPFWQRAPSRVTFEPKQGQKFVYSIRSRAVDLLPEDEEDE
jgi:hypothetical protein